MADGNEPIHDYSLKLPSDDPTAWLTCGFIIGGSERRAVV